MINKINVSDIKNIFTANMATTIRSYSSFTMRHYILTIGLILSELNNLRNFIQLSDLHRQT